MAQMVRSAHRSHAIRVDTVPSFTLTVPVPSSFGTLMYWSCVPDVRGDVG
jgi:hypothetical protein